MDEYIVVVYMYGFYLYVSGVFTMSYGQRLLVWPMYDFLQVLHVRLYIPLLSLSCVVSFVLCPRSSSLLYCVWAFVGDMYVGLSEEVSYLPDFGTMICKDGPFCVVIAFCLITLFGICLCFCLYLFLQSRYDMFREFPKHIIIKNGTIFGKSYWIQNIFLCFVDRAS